MNFYQSYYFLFFLLFTFHLPIICKPIPRKTLSLGSNERQIIPIDLQIYPPAAYALLLVGDPPIKERLHIDTGLELTWVVHNNHSGYDPLRSSSFNYRRCLGLSNSPHVFTDWKTGHCNYNIRLTDKAKYVGTLGNETFSFETGDRGLGTLNNVLFGFGQTLEGLQAGTGSLGLQLGELSILKSFDRKFSICIGNFYDNFREKHFLALADNAVFIGEKIALDTKKNMYKINLTSIKVNGKSLGLEDVLSKSITVVDTGTSSISLVKEVHYVVIDIITKTMIKEGYKRYQMDKVVCFGGTIPKHAHLQVSLVFDKVRPTMWSAYSIAKLLFLLLLVDASFGRSLNGFYRSGFARDLFKFLENSSDPAHEGYADLYVDLYGNMTIRWDIMNISSDSYTANVTIFNYLKKQDIQWPWELGWTWHGDEILLSTLGAKVSQQCNIMTHEDGCKHRVTFVDLLPQTDDDKQIVANCCKGGVIPSWFRFREADLSKSSSSFQFTVGQVNTEHHHPPLDVKLTTQGLVYLCDSLMEVMNTPGYLNTWRTTCGLYNPAKYHEIYDKEDL